MISNITPFNTDESFLERCQKVFEFQRDHLPAYNDFLEALGTPVEIAVDPQTVPLLPVSAFKHCDVISGGLKAELRFESSGTSAMTRSRHLVADTSLYQRAILDGFTEHFPLHEYSLIGYMPGYQENDHSSLIWMARYLMEKDPDQLSAFLPSGPEQLMSLIRRIEGKGKKILLFGAAFGLLDLMEENRIPEGTDLEILETGGMKTFRREMSKKELRESLSKGFGVELSAIHSEYGMCELMSQMYAIGGEWFSTPEWVYVTIRDHDDPLQPCAPGREGKIGIIDLANCYSCSFILTDDRGVMDQNGRFRVLGRWSSHNPRGCNFLVDR